MTREFSTKPRFEDNGDIEPCDNETRMMNRPDDFGVNGASSVKERAVPRGDDAVISVPLTQSPISALQGPGDEKSHASQAAVERPQENSAATTAASYAALDLSKAAAQSTTKANQMLNEDLQMTSEAAEAERTSKTSHEIIDDGLDLITKKNQDCDLLHLKAKFEPSKAALVEMRKSAVSLHLDGGNHENCHDDDDDEGQLDGVGLAFLDLGNADSKADIEKAAISVINSSSSSDVYSKPYDDSSFTKKMKTINDLSMTSTTLMIKPSDNDNDDDLYLPLKANKAGQKKNNNYRATKLPSPSIQDVQNQDEIESGATFAAGDVTFPSSVVKDQSPKNNAISLINFSSNGGTIGDAGAVLSQVATNDIPYFDDNIDELPSFNVDAQRARKQQKPANADCLSLNMLNCATQVRSSRSGWAVPTWIGLKGGAGGDTSLANGTSGWGPPPSANNAAAAASGWGAPPPPNPAASAAWGAPGSGSSGPGPKTQNDDGPNNAPASIAKPIAPVATPTPPSAASSTAASGPVQPPQTSTSWAAAAGKGLPTTTNDQTHTTSTASASNGSTSKHLEQLNSVREALFSQDGWGGSNVKQDSAWNVDGISANNASSASSATAASASASASTAQPSEAKESSMWGSAGNGHRNDGTDLWRVNLSGQPPASKPQPNNAWNHTPQNNTDFKQWGVDDEDAAAAAAAAAAGGAPNTNGAIGGQRQTNNAVGPNNPSDSMWGNDANGPGGNAGNQFGKRNNDWSSSGSTGSWGDAPGSRGDPMMNRNMNDPMGHSRGDAGNGNGGWGPSPQKQPISQWGNNPGSRNNSTWDLESPNMPRRGGGVDDGTAHWGFKPQQGGAPGTAVGGSHWKDMPTSNSQIRGPPGPPGPRLGGPAKDSSIWPRGPSGWGNDMNDAPGGQMGYSGSSGWGDMDKREPSVWPDSGNSSNSGWGRPRNPVGPANGAMHRSSPGWGQDDSPLDGGSGWPSGIKAVGGGGGPKKPTPTNDMSLMWQSKPYRMLLEMGYRKEDIETALRNSNGTLDDAMEVLNQAGRMPTNRNNDPMFGGHGDSGLYQDSSRRFPGPGQGMPYPQDPSLNPGLQSSFNSPNPMIQKMLPSGGMNQPGGSGNMPPSIPPISSTRPQQPSAATQPSAQQLRMLVQQIQMAVQAGHLNPQILNQPLAPQTLLLLNQLLQQIKALQTLQQNHTLAQAQKGMSNSRELLSISVNITKTKQHITNLQNQISAQQATYLKSQNMGSSGSGLSGAPPSHLTATGNEPSMPDLFNELTLGGSGSVSENVGGSRLSQWKLNDNLFPGKNGANGSAKNTSSPFGGDDTWGLSSNSTSSGWPDSKPNVGPGGPNNTNNSSVVNTSVSVTSVGANNSNNDALNGIDAFGIPEFEPGKPWKGPGLKNPDEDPTLTPGSVAPTAIDLMSKTNHSSSSTGGSNLVENTLGLTSPTWSFNNPTSSDNKPKDSWSTNSTSTLTAMGQDLWGKSGRTPPGLSGWPSTSGSSSNGWSSSGPNVSSANNNPADQPTWLLLKNLTPQIDGSTLKTLCIQHGPLKNFHLFLNNGIALVMYASGREASKAQKALNNCLLGNTTIQANMTSEGDANSIIQQLGGGSSQSAASRGATPSSSSGMPKSTSSDMWGNNMGGVPTSIYSSGANTIWGAPGSVVTSGDDGGQRNTPQLQPYLPGDLLGESNM